MSRIEDAGEIELALVGFVEVPGNGGRDDPEIGLADPFEANRPVPLGHAEVVHFGDVGEVFLLADHKFVIHNAQKRP